MKKITWRGLSSLLSTLLLVFNAAAASADDLSDAKGLVDKANTTLSNFIADPNMTWFRNNVHNAKGVFIVPTLGKAGFVFGGSGGTGVLLARDESSGKWSYPAFYTMGSATFGLQIGVQVAEVVLMVMTKKGMDSMLSTKFQLGGDASVAAGPVGAGAAAATADILQFARTKGVFGGLTLEGAVIGIRESLNTAYYGRAVRPVDILIRRDVSNAQANPLRHTLTQKTTSAE